MTPSLETESARRSRIEEALWAYGRGWALTPLRGKVPILTGWQKAAHPSRGQVTAWARTGNVGLRTGAISGIVVIDVDTSKGGDAAALSLPATVTVITGSGGLHLYFRHPGGSVPNSVGRLAPHVDVRGDGGQVVFVGSIHPVSGCMYRWADGLSPDDIGLAALPADVLTHLRPPRRVHVPRCSGLQSRHGKRYAVAALANETDNVRYASEGTRNQVLNKAAFCLGQLVGGGHLYQDEVLLELRDAAVACGLPEREALGTIRSGLIAGMREPR
jgi:hypothetical protein